ncbi:zinc metalloprotease [Formosimonas limnophila]|uniref:Zinc metalloprotease n=1 Tax=Formosimonas limnophila TaxID=1384487 RepID=A0A8J3FXE5_9BURK|nr:RIP metalloprotease RseP [Formosimonas limnophila]GHA64184.1 zinc metalloprotease [Formosimonas limnophila]
MTNVWAFLVAILVLVTIHEWGHYWVAKRCGVEIEKFSIGFGKPLFSWTNKVGTVFCIAAIPLGGYVKMKGEYAIATDENQMSQGKGSFASKTVWQRMAIVAAGPVINLLFALLIFMGLGYGDTYVTPTQVQAPAAQTLAAGLGLQTGDTIIRVNGREANDWSVVNRGVLDAVFERENLVLHWRNAAGVEHSAELPTASLNIEEKGWNDKIGLTPKVVPLNVGRVVDSSGAAAQAGLQQHDVIVSVNGQSIDGREAFIKIIQASAGQSLNVSVIRDQQTLSLNLTPVLKGRPIVENGEVVTKVVGTIGAELLTTQVKVVHVGILEAIPRGFNMTYDAIALTVKGLYKIATGQLSLKNIGGPVSIAQVMGEGAKSSVTDFVSRLAWLSISLGVLNLLPIPMLDGGHLMYYVVELIKGSPVSERALALGQTVGMAFLMMFMGIAFYNDFMRLFG